MNVWITRPPYVLLPTVLVLAALFGHVLVLRKLRALRKQPLSASGMDSADRHRLGKA